MPAQNYSVFISYSRANEDQKRRLLIHLASLSQDGTINRAWHDRCIEAGDLWRQELDQAMSDAEVALFLVSGEFLASRFCQEVEVPRMLERHRDAGVLIVPLIIDYCDWRPIKWLNQFQALPEDGDPITAQKPYSKAWTQVVQGLRRRLENKPPSKKSVRAAAPPKDDKKPPNLSLAKLLEALPGEAGDLFGREEALGWLDDAYANSHVSVLALVGFGGVGKSALVRHWLETRFSEADRRLPRFLGVSFYSQGTREQEAGSSDQFLIHSLELVGEESVGQKSAWDRGQRLAELLAEKPTVLVLDGLEPLQYGPGPHHLEGHLKDPGVHALLAELAEHSGNVLCVVSTRIPLTDDDLQSRSFVQKSVEILSAEAARDLMLARGVHGSGGEIAEAVEYLGRHPLALVMAAEYLHTFADGHVNRLDEISLLSAKTKEGRHAKSVMAAYEKALDLDGDPLDLELLGILGIFDRPTRWEWLKALSTPPPIKNVTDHLVHATDRELWESISRLRQWGMLADPGSVEAPQLDAHPLIREYFGERLKNQNKKAWRSAHSRMFDHLVSTTKEFPDTLEEMEPLYQAIAHGCAAGRHQYVFDEVYWHRVQRQSFLFSTKNLGAFGADLTALRGFFLDPWRQPVPGLEEEAKSLVLYQAGHNLRALGQLRESAQSMEASLAAEISHKRWLNAAKVVDYLCDTYLIIGDLSRALVYADQSMDLADQTGEEFQQVVSRLTFASALHRVGRLTEAENSFREAENMLKEREGSSAFIYSFEGFYYCELLLDQGKYQEVQARAGATLAWVTQQGLLLEVALDSLSLGRAHLLQAQQENPSHFVDASYHLKRAVDGLRQAGRLEQLPRGLLVLAELYRVTGEFDTAEADMGEAMRIATRGEMGLHEADCHLEYARLYLVMGEKENDAKIQQENREKAREHWNTAKEMIERMGYHRRDKDVTEIEAQLAQAS